ncbi:hypothetical protein PG993_005631 [Apiospora rasikravindrae]|uniref:Uncharacterized protein n=1 Tax=Apiospora rasikravindrae TaxID=990691 RepID=A0ABR1TGT9_9PEZI
MNPSVCRPSTTDKQTCKRQQAESWLRDRTLTDPITTNAAPYQHYLQRTLPSTSSAAKHISPLTSPANDRSRSSFFLLTCPSTPGTISLGNPAMSLDEATKTPTAAPRAARPPSYPTQPHALILNDTPRRDTSPRVPAFGRPARPPEPTS